MTYLTQCFKGAERRAEFFATYISFLCGKRGGVGGVGSAILKPHSYTCRYIVISELYMLQDPLRKIPGPVSLPLIGNVHLLDPTKMHVQMYEWAEKYGPVMKFSIFNKPYVVLNSLEGCLEAKHHRGKLHLDQIGVTSCRGNKSLHTLRWRPPVTKECLVG